MTERTNGLPPRRAALVTAQRPMGRVADGDDERS
jgi:hypothetical protein